MPLLSPIWRRASGRTLTALLAGWPLLGAAAASQPLIDIPAPPVATAEAPLRQAAQSWAAQQRRDWQRSLPPPDLQPPPAGQPWQIQLRYAAPVRTAGFVSLVARGYRWSGGAHPSPLLQSFVYDRQRQRLIRLADVFAQPRAALSAICKQARRQLLARLQPPPGQAALASDPAMIEAGTGPAACATVPFLWRGPAAGPVQQLRLLFPSYAVAPYVAGPQTVDIDPRVFSRWLRAAERHRFDRSAP